MRKNREKGEFTSFYVYKEWLEQWLPSKNAQLERLFLWRKCRRNHPIRFQFGESWLFSQSCFGNQMNAERLS
jgi:hypothetical protein